MKTTRLPQLAIAAVTIAAALSSQPAIAADDDEFIEDATLEELAEAGYLIKGADDVDAKMVNFQHMMDNRADAIRDLAILAFGKEAAEIAALGEMLGLTDLLELVEYMPAATGQPGKPSIITDLADLTPGPDLGGLSAKFPGKGSLAADGWHRTSVSDGTETWERTHTDEHGTTTSKRMIVQGEEVISTSSRVESADGRDVTEVHSERQEDGGTVTTYRKLRDNEVVEEVTDYQGPGVDEHAPLPGEKEGGDIDKLPPADGSGEVYCPLYLPACRAAAEEIQKDMEDPYRLISGFVHVNPGPAGETEDTKVNPLVTDPDPWAVNPDPHAVGGYYGKAPSGIKFRLPVIILPPKPGP